MIIKLIMIFLFGFGGLMCCLNFYLSFLRYPVHIMMGRKKEDYKWVSGIPVFGSLFVAISLFKFWQPTWLLVFAIILILIDTAGLHWMAGYMLYYEVLKKEKHQQTTDREN